MEYFILVFIILIIAFLIGLYIVFRIIYKCDKKSQNDPFYYYPNKQYDKHYPKIMELVKKALEMPYEDIYITAKDKIKLHGKLYILDDNAPIHIMFHGYNGNDYRDFAGTLAIVFKMKHNVLLIDERGQGKSEGHAMTFGIKERYDALCWIDYLNKRFNPNKPIILVGASMGAATVLMTTDLALPENVKGVIADAGYSSPKAIIDLAIANKKLPVRFFSLLARLSGIIYGGFDINKYSPIQALQNAKVPVLFIHGDDDRFVPYCMSKENYNACSSEKHFVTVSNAGHVLSSMENPQLYEDEYVKFCNKILNEVT